MKIIISGMGKVGQTLAESLIKENHEITVIDIKEENVNNTVEKLDCMGIVGNSAIQSILNEADVENCDVLIACTNKDEINMLTCLLAHKNSKCKTIARIREPEYYEQIRYLQEELNITFIINPERTCATEMTDIMRHASNLSSDSFLGGRIKLQKVLIERGNILCGVKLKSVNKIIGNNILFCIIERGDEIIIPRGDDVIREDDKISFFADELGTKEFFKKAGYEYNSVKSIMIIGYSMITRYFIENMLRVNSECKIKVIEKDKNKCDEINELFENVAVIQGSGVDKKLLLEEGLKDTEAFASLTGIDEENIILSLNAKKYIKGNVLTKINNLSLLEDLKDLVIGSIINPEVIAANVISLMVRRMVNKKGSSIESLYRLCDNKVEVLQFLVKNEDSVINVSFKNMKLKKNILVACIYRDGKIIVPRGDDSIHLYDKVVIVSKDNVINNIKEILEDE